jgi:hypothetical protein
MDSEAKIILAFLFKRSGKNALKESELYLPLSMELGWFSSKEAQDFVTYAVTKGLLVKKDTELHPNFPLEKITIPTGFSPTKKLFTEKSVDKKTGSILDDIIGEIQKKTNRDAEEHLQEIKHVAQEKNMLLEVAALYIARQYDVDISGLVDRVEMNIFTGKTG